MVFLVNWIGGVAFWGFKVHTLFWFMGLRGGEREGRERGESAMGAAFPLFFLALFVSLLVSLEERERRERER